MTAIIVCLFIESMAVFITASCAAYQARMVKRATERSISLLVDSAALRDKIRRHESNRTYK